MSANYLKNNFDQNRGGEQNKSFSGEYHIYIYIHIHILIKKMSVMHSLTKTLMPGVHKPGFPKWDRLVRGRDAI